MQKSKSETRIPTKCPWCHQKIGFEFKHTHKTTTETISKLSKIVKLADDERVN